MNTCLIQSTRIPRRRGRRHAAILVLILNAVAAVVSHLPAPVGLGSAANYAVLASSTATSTGAPTLTRDLGAR